MERDPVDAGLSMPAGATRCVCWPDAGIAGSPVGELRVERPAVPASVRDMRTSVRDWATSAGFDPSTVDAIVLAVDEAVTNVVDHAHPADHDHRDGSGTVEIVLHAASRPCGAGAAVSIADDGTWRPPPPDPGHRGRGVHLMGRLSDRSTITTTDRGTTVRLCWALPAR